MSGHLSALRSDDARVEALVQSSISLATRVKYDAYWARWLEYCKIHRHTVLPASVDSTVLFLASVAADGSRTNVTAAAAAISWYHSIAGFEAPTKSPKSAALLAGARRLLAAPHGTGNVGHRATYCQYRSKFARAGASAADILCRHRLFRLSTVQRLSFTVCETFSVY